MTNAELIATIRNEIERRITDNTFGAKLELIDILAWLDTIEESTSKDFPTTDEEIKQFLTTHPKVELPEKYKTPDWIFEKSEKPMQYGLEEEIERYLHSLGVGYGGWVDGMEDDDLRGIARHFYDLGCRRTAEKADEIEYNRQRAEDSVPNDLEEAANKFAVFYDQGTCDGIAQDCFIAGAKWQAEQLLKSSPLPEDTVLFNKGVEEGRRLERDEFENNRLAACNNQTKEEYNRETDFALEIIKKEHRQPTFSDAINYGMQLQKGQMMNNAIECLVCAGMEGDKWIMTYIGSYESMLETCKAGDKVRIIIVKEDKK